MKTFQFQTHSSKIPALQYIAGTRHLNIRFGPIVPLPGAARRPADEPDVTIEISLLSDDPGELITLGWYAGKQKMAFDLH